MQDLNMFNFFQGKKIIHFDVMQSLLVNFYNVNSLSRHKLKKKPIQNLLDKLSYCELNLTTQSIERLNREERRKDVLVLELAKLAIEDWREKNNKDAMLILVLNLLNEIRSLQIHLIQTDHAHFLKSLNYPKVWLNPLYDKEILHTLSKEQKEILSLKSFSYEQNERELKVKPIYSFAIFMPFINLFLDSDFGLDFLNVVVF